MDARHSRTRSATSAAVSETTNRVPFASTITVSGFASMTWIRSGFTYSSWSGWVMRWTAITPSPFGVGAAGPGSTWRGRRGRRRPRLAGLVLQVDELLEHLVGG